MALLLLCSLKRQLCLMFCLFSTHLFVTASDESKVDKLIIVDCSTLRLGQYICPDPSINQIDPDTQQFKGCTKGKETPENGEAEGIIYIDAMVLFGNI